MRKLSDEQLNNLIEKRRYLHENPELGFQEVNTTSQIKNWLLENEIPILPSDLKTGVIAEIKGQEQGPTIAIRADIDALPIKEETEVPFKSSNEGVMHACGHDFHTVSILGAAILLNEQRDQLKGNVRFIFQPAEETAEGAKYVIEHGALENVKAIFGMHNKPELPVGTIGVKSKGLMASVDKFKITFHGIGGHAGIPHDAIDPVVMASQYVTAVQSIIARNINLFHNAVISVTSINGGNTWNVIPDKVVLQGTVRTFQPEAREAIPGLMKRLAKSTAEGYGGTAAFDWSAFAPVVNNDPMYEHIVRSTVEQLDYNAVEAEPSSAGEDFADYQTQIPGYFVFMGVDGPKQWHHPAFDLKEDAIRVAVEFFSELAINVLQDAEKSK